MGDCLHSYLTDQSQQWGRTSFVASLCLWGSGQERARRTLVQVGGFVPLILLSVW